MMLWRWARKTLFFRDSIVVSVVDKRPPAPPLPSPPDARRHVSLREKVALRTAQRFAGSKPRGCDLTRMLAARCRDGQVESDIIDVATTRTDLHIMIIAGANMPVFGSPLESLSIDEKTGAPSPLVEMTEFIKAHGRMMRIRLCHVNCDRHFDPAYRAGK